MAHNILQTLEDMMSSRSLADPPWIAAAVHLLAGEIELSEKRIEELEKKIESLTERLARHVSDGQPSPIRADTFAHDSFPLIDDAEED